MSSSFRAAGARARHGSLRTLPVAAAACLGTGLLLTACSGSAPSASNSGNGGSDHRALGIPAAAPARQRAGAPGSSGGGSGKFSVQATGLRLSTQSIIHTAFLTDRVNNVTAAATTDTNLVTAAGGYVSSEQETVPPGRHGVPQISLGLKIPVAQYFPVLAKLRSLPGGKEVSFTQRAQDVTQQVADVGSRVASAQAAISQLRALLRRAGSVGALLSVQDEINSQEASLEALLAQQRSLAHETSFGTVTVTLFGHHAKIVPHKKHKKSSPGFTAGLSAGWHGLVLVVGWVLTALGSLLPFLISAALIAAIAFEVRRRLARRKTPPAADPPAPVTP
jgi:hypothetical protein